MKKTALYIILIMIVFSITIFTVRAIAPIFRNVASDRDKDSLLNHITLLDSQWCWYEVCPQRTNLKQAVRNIEKACAAPLEPDLISPRPYYYKVRCQHNYDIKVLAAGPNDDSEITFIDIRCPSEQHPTLHDACTLADLIMLFGLPRYVLHDQHINDVWLMFNNNIMVYASYPDRLRLLQQVNRIKLSVLTVTPEDLATRYITWSEFLHLQR